MRTSLNQPFKGKVTQNIYTEYPNRAARRKLISTRPDQNFTFVKFVEGIMVKTKDEENADGAFHYTRGFRKVRKG